MRLHLGQSVDAVLKLGMLGLDLESSNVAFLVVDEVAKLWAYETIVPCDLSHWQEGQSVCEELFREGQ